MSRRCVAGVGLGGVLLLTAAVGCGSESDDDGGPAAPACAGDPLVAFNRNGEYEGLAEVVIARGDTSGRLDLVSGDWVATRPSFSPDGRQLVVVRADGDYESGGPGSTDLWTIDVASGTPGRALTEGSFDDAPTWSPDGETIAFSRFVDGRARLMTVAAEGGGPEPLLPASDAADTAPAWSPDGDAIAFVRTDVVTGATAVWLADADGGNARELAAVTGAHSLSWHPDSDGLLVSSLVSLDEGHVTRVDVGRGTAPQIADDAMLATWAPDGEHVYFFTRDGADRSGWLRLVRGRIDQDHLVPESDIADVEDYLIYPYFGLAVSPCG
jgi:dipeptidyl aminopeptidase/acylaminoacyl peptidase